MLDVLNVSMAYGAGTLNYKKALDNVTLHVDDGDFITIIGSNGAGKTTLFNAIAGTFITDEGTIILDGQDITLAPEFKRAKNIGRMFQDPMLGSAPDLSIMDNMALAAGKGGWISVLTKAEKQQFRDKIAILEMGLENKMDKPVRQLSGGQRQALTLLMATYHAPKLLLLDEHTAALDPATAEKVLEITKSVVEENHITCLMITHNMQNALDFGNRTFMMNNGKIIYDVKGEERAGLTVSNLLEKFKANTGAEFAADRVLLTQEN